MNTQVQEKMTTLNEDTHNIKLGWKVRDRSSGFTGIATCRLDYPSGNCQFGVQPRIADDATNTMPSSIYIDEYLLEKVDDGIREVLTNINGVNPENSFESDIQVGDTVFDSYSKVEGVCSHLRWSMNGCLEVAIVLPLDDQGRWQQAILVDAVHATKVLDAEPAPTQKTMAGPSAGRVDSKFAR